MSTLITHTPLVPSIQCRKTITVWEICSSFALRGKKKSLFKDNYCLRICYKNTSGFVLFKYCLIFIVCYTEEKYVYLSVKVGLVNSSCCSAREVQKAFARIRVIIIISIIILFLLKF